ncbi:MAG TPA: hypothetical protein VHS55_07695 [Solirubrobacteraceae bacterium]|jgi:hypothetical protein|nr:hypothetical protein [Solirubrobacteraceae bacterium]
MSHATSIRQPPIPAAAKREQGPRLRLVDDAQTATTPAKDERVLAEHRAQAQGNDQVLVAGADAAARALMLAELCSLLPEETSFVEASETWEVVAHAAGSRMVVLAGDLGDVSCSSLLGLLARRNPALPVLVVGNTDRRSSRTPARSQPDRSASACGLQAPADVLAAADHGRRRALDAARG